MPPGNVTPATSAKTAGTVVRGQSPHGSTRQSAWRDYVPQPSQQTPSTTASDTADYLSSGRWDGRNPMPASEPVARTAQAPYTSPSYEPLPSGSPPYNSSSFGPEPTGVDRPPFTGTGPYPDLPGTAPLPPPGQVLGADPFQGPPPNGLPADLIVTVDEAPTGRFMVGAGINSDAGVTGQIVLDEQNFDWRRFPSSIDDIFNGTAFRGDGQRLRIEALPGSVVQRYMINFVDPFWMDTRISLSISAFLFDRNYFDWDERRLGGRVGLGYRLTPDLSVNVAMRGENVDIHDPRIRGVTELEEVLGKNELWSGKVTLAHDTRDIPFFPTEGHFLEFSYEQVFGEFDYPRGAVDYRRYFLLSERADGSGRHVLSHSMRLGFSGANTPLFENYFAGGHSTMRGFKFRGASPEDQGITVGGEFSMLGSAEYVFPVTADDMLRGVLFVDYGTIEESIEINGDDFRVALGAGMRITVPAMGPAPIAIDFAVPVMREDTDDIQNFSFYVGFGRN